MGRGAETRNAILAAGLRLMAKRGINSVSIREIQDEAGVNLALAYYHFENRDGLIRAIMEEAAQGLRDDWERTLGHYERPSSSRFEPKTVLRDLFRPVIVLSAFEPDKANVLGQLLVSPEPRLSLMAASIFRDTFVRFSDHLRRSLVHGVSEAHFEVSLELMTGSLIILLARSNPKASTAMRKRQSDGGMALLTETVEFCHAGLTSHSGASPAYRIRSG